LLVVPRCVAQDDGDNIATDNFTVVTVSLGANPSHGTLYPTYLRYVLPGVEATVAYGSSYIYTNASTMSYLIHGDLIELGTVNEVRRRSLHWPRALCTPSRV
jgi:hypothetical protein